MNKPQKIQLFFLGLVISLSFSFPKLSAGQLPNAYEYYPLAVGNEWIHWVLQFDPYSNQIIVSDTLLGDTLRVYKILTDDKDVSYYYYNKDSTVVYQSQTFPENMNSGFPFLDTRHGLGGKWVVTYNGITRAFAIKDTVTVNIFGELRNVAQNYEVYAKSDTVNYIDALGRYATGIGLIQFWESGLVFAKINGVEYGERPTSVEDEQQFGIPADFQLQIYPNPVNTSATFLISSPTLSQFEFSIINILGRTVRKFTITPRSQNLQLVWDGADNQAKVVSNGTYFALARVGELVKIMKFTYLKR